MRRMWMGMATAAFLWGSAGTALANEQGQQSKSTMNKEGQKRSEEQQKMGKAAVRGQHELTGEIVSIKGDTLYLRKYDAIIPVKVQDSTEVNGRPMMKSQSVSDQLKTDFREGEQVRTSFNIQDDTNNVATNISAVGQHHRGAAEKPSQQQSPKK